jgi:hypothetical protein
VRIAGIVAEGRLGRVAARCVANPLTGRRTEDSAGRSV